jgi:hypothetical protein
MIVIMPEEATDSQIAEVTQQVKGVETRSWTLWIGFISSNRMRSDYRAGFAGNGRRERGDSV